MFIQTMKNKIKMLIISKVYITIIFVAFSIFSSCDSDIDEGGAVAEVTDTLNYSHFDHLYKEIDFQGEKVGIVHIYSQYPNYEYAIEPSEGFTCVDDVARAAVLFSKRLMLYGEDEEVFNKLRKMIEFVLQMQNENGYFNNFIWNDLSINTTYKTSIAELNWWSFRALWALESAYPLVKSDTDLANRIVLAIEKLIANIKRDLPVTSFNTTLVSTVELPTWLPQKYASDQSALLIIGLLKNYERTMDNEVKSLIDAFAKGIIIMQKGDGDNYPYGAFLSWGNLWHAWGNSQSYALLKAGRQLNNQEYIDSALKEIDNFYPYLLMNGFAEAFWINKVEENSYIEIDKNKYPQIAYGLRPMVYAVIEAYQYSKDDKYVALAKSLESWLSGKNDAEINIYDPNTGVCFDGIVAPSEVNKNSGAESTIESLLVLLEIKKLK